MGKLEDKIIAKSEIEKQNILSQAILKADKVYEDLIKEAKVDIELTLEKSKKKYQTHVQQKEQEVKKELRDEVAVAKQKLVESVFTELATHLSDLSGDKLFNYILSGLKNETLLGDEVIAVNKNDYQKYHDVLSTKKGDLVECDLLNKKLGSLFTIKLSNKPVRIKNGFLLVGTDFDLNFSFNESIEKLSKKFEKKIYEELN